MVVRVCKKAKQLLMLFKKGVIRCVRFKIIFQLKNVGQLLDLNDWTLFLDMLLDCKDWSILKWVSCLWEKNKKFGNGISFEGNVHTFEIILQIKGECYLLDLIQFLFQDTKNKIDLLIIRFILWFINTICLCLSFSAS